MASATVWIDEPEVGLGLTVADVNLGHIAQKIYERTALCVNALRKEGLKHALWYMYGVNSSWKEVKALVKNLTTGVAWHWPH